MRKRQVCVALCAGLFVGPALVSAATISFDDTIPVTTTDWTSSVSLPRFNPALGTLNSVMLELEASVQGSTFYENLEPGPFTVMLQLSADVRLFRPDNSLLLLVSPADSRTENAGAFDGTIDFGGTSGNTFLNLLGIVSDSMTSPPPLSDLVLFTGLSPITLPVTAIGNSSGQGPGNWIFGFNTTAGAKVTVTYDYTPIPEPAAMALMLVGASAMLVRRARKQVH